MSFATRWARLGSAPAPRRIRFTPGWLGAAAPASALPIALALGVALAPSVAAAQGPAIPAPTSADTALASTLAPRPIAIAPAPMPRGMADTVTVLPPILVKGARALAPERTASTQVRLGRGALNRFLPSTSGDALLTVPGVELVKLGPWSSRVSFRGLSGDRVLVMIDGVRVNTVRGHGAQASLVSVDRLDEVELLPGASSAQFGSDAMGGVINLVTHRDLFSEQARAHVSLSTGGSEPGSGWNQNARARLLFPGYGFELSGGLSGLTRLHTPDGEVPNSGYREEDLRLRGAARWGLATFDLEHSRHAARDVGLPAFADDAGSSGSYPVQSRDADRFEFQLPGAGLRPAAKLLAVYQSFRTDYRETAVDTTYLRGRPVATTSRSTFDRTTSPSWGIQPELRWTGPFDVRLNGEYRREETAGPREAQEIVRNSSGAVVSVHDSVSQSVPPASREVASVSVFGGRTTRIARFELGARWDVMRSRADTTTNSHTSELDVTDRRLSGEAGISRRFRGCEPYLHVASGFRGPNLQERFYNNTIHGGMRLFGTPGLEAERSVSYEFGVRAGETWGGRVQSLRLSAYRSDVEDLINLKYLGLNRGLSNFQYVNIERARIEGLEVAGQFRFGGVGVGVNLAVPRGRDLVANKRLVDAGTARATLDLSLPAPWLLPNGRVGARARWNDAVTDIEGAVDTQDALRRPSFWTGSLELSSAYSGFLVMASVRNLGNLRYQEPMSFVEEPGRTFVLSLRRDFNLNLARP